MTIQEMSFTGGVLIAAILLLRRCALFRLPKWTFLLLWGAALCRLLIPFSFPSPFSLYTGAEALAQAASSVQEEYLADPVPQPESHPDEPPVVILPLAPQEKETAPARPAAPEPEKTALPPLTALYLTGAGLCALWFAAAYLWGLARFRDAEPVDAPILTRWRGAHPRPRVRFRQSRAVSAPLTYGLLRPTILFPLHMDWSDGPSLSYVLAHEYVHIRRRDVFWKLLLAAALCAHWFNPLVWAMYIFANRDLELACDEAVVHSFGLSARPAYALSLLQAAESRPGFLPLCSGYKKSAAEERILAIMKTNKSSLAAVLLGAAVTAAAVAIFVTGPMSVKTEPVVLPEISQTEPDQSSPVQPQTSAPSEQPSKPVTPVQPEPDTPIEPVTVQPEPRPAPQSNPAPVQQKKPASAYPTNSKGHTYGQWTPADGYDDVPDLIYIHWNSETEGYMKREEVYPYGWYLGPDSSQEDLQRYLDWYHEIARDDGPYSSIVQPNFRIYDQEETSDFGYFTGLHVELYPDNNDNYRLSDEALLERVSQGNSLFCTVFCGTAPPENIPERDMRPVFEIPQTEEEWAYLREWTDENGDWRRNSKGQTYGPIDLTYTVGYFPDLIYVRCDDHSGYVTQYTYEYGNYPEPENGASVDWDDFKKWQKSQNAVDLVNLYDVEMKERVGYMRYLNH